MVFKLIEGFQGHHRQFSQKIFKDQNGHIALTNTENAKILRKHYHKVFNCSVPVNMTVLNLIQQHFTAYSLGDPPTDKDIFGAIQGMKNNKTPDKTGMTTDMIKNLLSEALSFIASLRCNFWTNQNINFQTWHITKLSNLYKGKGDQQDPNNWRGICLKETSVKIVSIIVAKLFLKHLKQISISSQFGHIHCQEALHSIRSALMLRHHHGLKKFVLFVDLVKAFDLIQHEVLYTILKKIWTSPHTHQHNQKTLQQLLHQYNHGKRKEKCTI